METRIKQTLPIAEILSYGRPYYDEPIEIKKRPEWFKACCKYVCPDFKIDESNKNLMNQLFLYAEGRSEKLDVNKGLLLRGNIGTGKSTIMQILNRYSYFTRGKSKGGYRSEDLELIRLPALQTVFRCVERMRWNCILTTTEYRE